MRLPQGYTPPSNSSTATPAVEPVTALAFSSGSRYLCSAGGSGGAGVSAGSTNAGACVVSIWDLKKHEKSRKLVGHTDGVTALDFGAQDGYVASASIRGAILVHNLNLASLACKLQTSGATPNAPLRDLQHSPHKRHLLAACGDGGALEVWDLNTSQQYASLVPGSGGVSGPLSSLSALRFSTTSASLVASVGLDKRLCFYDTNSRKCIRDILTEDALTSVDYHADGTSLVVGTMSGHILLYDIRAASKPTARIMNAHAGRPVHAIKFTNVVATTSSSSASSTGGKTIPRATGAAAPPATPSSSNTASATAASLYDAKSSTFIDSRGEPTPARGTSSAISNQTANHNFAHNATALLPSSALNMSTLSLAPHNQTAPAGALQLAQHAAGGELFSPIKGDASNATGGVNGFVSPFGATSYANQSMMRGGGGGGMGATSTSMGTLAFNSPIDNPTVQRGVTFGGPNDGGLLLSPIHATTGGAGLQYGGSNSSIVAPPAHLTSSTFIPPTRTGALTAVAPHLSAFPAPVPARGGNSSSSSSSTALTTLPVGGMGARHGNHPDGFLDREAAASASVAAVAGGFATAAPASPTPRAHSAIGQQSHLASSSYGFGGGSAAASMALQHALLPSPMRGGGFTTAASSPHAAAASSPSSSFAGGVGASSVPGVGGVGLTDYHVSVLRSMLDESLYSLRSELRSQVSDLHVEMLKQFHAAAQDQARAMEAFTSKFEHMIAEVKDLREDYRSLRHTY